MPRFYKLLAEDLCHKGFTYKEGLNVDHIPFNPCGSCHPGGLYYTMLEHLPLWHSEMWPLIADVTVPAEAQVYTEPCGTKWKADRIELSNIRPLRDFLATLDATTLCDMVTRCVHMLEFVPQSVAVCLAAVRKNGFALRMIQHQTDAICLAAVQQDGEALQSVLNKTDAICLAAVQNNPYALFFVPEQTEALCLIAVQRDPVLLRFVHKQTEALCLAAVQQCGLYLFQVENRTEALCLTAVQQDGNALVHVYNQTEAICRAAVAQNPAARQFVKL